MTEQDKATLIQGLDLQISAASNGVLQSPKPEQKAIGRETIAYLNALITKVEAIKEEVKK